MKLNLKTLDRKTWVCARVARLRGALVGPLGALPAIVFVPTAVTLGTAFMGSRPPNILYGISAPPTRIQRTSAGGRTL